jgi:hypothetical protein
MRRSFFVQTFHGWMEGLEPLEPLRKTGLYAYDSVPRYGPASKIRVSPGVWASSTTSRISRPRPTVP